MIILASKPQIWPCFAVGSSIRGDRAALPWLRSLSAAKLVGNKSQVHETEDTRGGITGGQDRKLEKSLQRGDGSGFVAVPLLLVYLVTNCENVLIIDLHHLPCLWSW